MNRELAFEIIKKTIVDVIPTMKGIEIKMHETFKSHNINSIERMEINMLLLEEIELDIPFYKIM